uniref:Uncharacterized protein n=1 Tax=viral metagenome TaxID=1070528 RepID=A0A6C0BMG8_9ZZZZ
MSQGQQKATELAKVLDRLTPLRQKSTMQKRALIEHMQKTGQTSVTAHGKTFTLERKDKIPGLSYKSVQQMLTGYESEFEVDLDIPDLIKYMKEDNKRRAKTSITLKIT